MEIQCFCQIFLWSIHLDETPATRQDSIINVPAVQPVFNHLPAATTPRQPHDADCRGPKDVNFLQQMSIRDTSQFKRPKAPGAEQKGNPAGLRA